MSKRKQVHQVIDDETDKEESPIQPQKQKRINLQ
jgi:hypothetical protein